MTGMIYVGADVLEKRLPTLTCGQKNFVVTDSNVYALYPEFFKKYFGKIPDFLNDFYLSFL